MTIETKINNWDEETESRVAKAIAFFKEGYNCSQSVAMAFADMYGISECMMSRISASFGGGIGRMRETCGAACSMFLLAGLEVTNVDDSCGCTGAVLHDTELNPYPDQEVKKKDYEIVQMLAENFRKEAGSIICKDLLGLNKKRADGTIPDIKIVATPEARTDEYYKKRPCIRMVEIGVRIYMGYLRSKYEKR